MSTSFLIALGLGILFGFALVKGGLTQYTNIAGVYRFTNLTVIKFMLTALVTASIGLYTLKQFGLVQFPNVPATYIAGNLLGGLIFGAGMGLAGYCPGTIVAGAGEGKLDYLLAGGLGLFVGTTLWGFTYPVVFPAISSIGWLGNVTIPQLWNVEPLLVVAVFAVFTLILFYFLEHGLKRKDRLEK